MMQSTVNLRPIDLLHLIVRLRNKTLGWRQFCYSTFVHWNIRYEAELFSCVWYYSYFVCVSFSVFLHFSNFKQSLKLVMCVCMLVYVYVYVYLLIYMWFYIFHTPSKWVTFVIQFVNYYGNRITSSVKSITVCLLLSFCGVPSAVCLISCFYRCVCFYVSSAVFRLPCFFYYVCFSVTSTVCLLL